MSIERRPRFGGRPNEENGTMFDRRSELQQLLTVAEEGRIVAAAERLSMTQPALTRAIARLERRAGGALFERLPTGVRLTALGTVAVERARRLAREFADTDEHIGETVAGRGGRLRVSAAPLWMRAVIAPAARRFQKACPGVGLTLRSAAFAEGVRLLAAGAGDLHWGGIDDGCPLPAFLRRETLLRVTAGIVAHRGHPLHGARPDPGDLLRHPWLECCPSEPPGAGGRGLSLASFLERLRERTGGRPGPVLRAGAAGLLLLAEGPWLSWFPFAFLARLPALGLKPLPLTFGRRRCRTGLVARRAAEDLAPVRTFEDIARAIALERPA